MAEAVRAPAPPPRDRRPAPPAAARSRPAAPVGTTHRAAVPPAVASAISSSLGVDVSGVRVHTDASAVAAAGALGARAFAVGGDIVLGAGTRPTDLGVMAHEVAHVVQQGGAPRLQLFSARGGDAYERDAQRAAAAVASGQRYVVRERVPAPRVQRLGISDALDYFADKANLIPGYRMLTILIGVNPINMSRVERSAANILRAIIEFIPGGGLITQALDKYGVFERAGSWVEQQMATLGISGAMFRQALDRFLDSLSWRDIFHLGDVWDRAKRIFTDPISRIITFAANLAGEILRMIKDAILRPLAGLAEGTRGWDLLCAVLGQNPITGEPVPRNAQTLIGGFMKLIGQEEVWQNIQRANAIPRAWAWFQGALAELLALVRQIPRLFIGALRELEIADIVLLPRAFAKVGRVFLGFVGDFIGWAGRQVLSLLQIIFEVLAPAAMPYLRKAMGAFRTIIGNPVGFIGNLVRAGIQGFRGFAGNFLSHLRRSLIEWLTGTLSGAGVYIPQAFELREILKFVLSVLGLTWQNIRQKLLRHIPEGVLRALETGLDIVVTLVREGPAAAWAKISEQLSNLREMVMEQIMSFVRERIVQAAITRLLTSLNPAGAFIQAVIAIYNTVMFVVERLRQIGQVAMSFIDSISAIAAGAVGAAAARVEQTMAGLLTLVISFLARLVGLGRVSDAVKGIVDRIRAPIDRALDFVVTWIIGTATRLGRLAVGAARAGVARLVSWWRVRRGFRGADGTTHTLFFAGEGAAAALKVASVEMPIEVFLARAAATASADPVMRARHDAARLEAAAIRRLISELGSGADARQPDKVDELNRRLGVLGQMLVPLFPATTPTSFAPGMFIKVVATGRTAVIVSATAAAVEYRVFSRADDPPQPITTPLPVFTANWARGAFLPSDTTNQTRRALYMGSTPDKAGGVGQQVLQRMAAEGRYRPDRGGEIAYRRDASGHPLPPGAAPRWVSVRNCDMGHVIDAVHWWNANGRFTGARSAQVRAFMIDPINYEFEPSAENRARGARAGAEYLPPVT